MRTIILGAAILLTLAACGGDEPFLYGNPDGTGSDAAAGDAGGDDVDEDPSDRDGSDDADPADVDTSDVVDDADPGDADPVDTDPGDADPGDADPDDADASDTDPDTDPDTGSGECGDGRVDDGELCDGDALGGLGCAELGYDGGTLACAGDCESFDTTACTSECVPTCGARECGADPTCGISCGTCAEGVCDDGTCVVASSGGPRIVSFATDVSHLTEGESVTFSAIVSDPDGVEDIAGGQLADPATDAIYGAMTPVGGGSFSIEVDWAQVHRVRPIRFDAPISRPFEARFFDLDGNPATDSVTVLLTCGSDAGACEGVCTALDTETDCRACGVVCADTATCGEVGCECGAGRALCDGLCVNLGTATDCTACGETCRDDQVCGGSGCVCPAGLEECDGVCVRLDTTSHCGSCGETCRDDQVCGGSGCVCPDDFGECDGVCTDLTTSDDCGTCGNTCSEDGFCSGGVCGCAAGERGCFGECSNAYLVDRCGGDCESCDADAWCDSTRCRDAWTHELRVNEAGNLELKRPDEWMVVCGDGFDEVDAAVACRQLGGELVAFETDRADTTGRPFGLSGVRCGLSLSTEYRLTACPHDGWPVEACESGAVSVVCEQRPEPEACTEFEPGAFVVNEALVRTSVSDSALRFVEIAGPPSTSVDGLVLQLIDGDTGETYLEQVLSGTTNEDGLYVVGGADVAERDVDAATAIRAGPGSIRLAGCEVVDGVQHQRLQVGITSAGESGLAVNDEIGWSFGRDIDSTDTDDNSADFAQYATPTPGAPNISPTVLPSSWSGTLDSGTTFRSPGPSCFYSPATSSYYRAMEFVNGSPEPIEVRIDYLFENDGWGADEAYGSVHVYDGPFDPDAPRTNCVDQWFGTDSYFYYTVPAFTRLPIVVSTNTAANPIDSWEITVSRREAAP